MLTGQHRQQRCHSLCGGTLTDTAVGHQEGACADGAVETLHETAAGGASKAACHVAEAIKAGGGQTLTLHSGDRNIGVLHGTVGGQEVAGEVGDGVALPVHDHAVLVGDGCHHVGLQILTGGGSDEGIHILGGYHHGHTLLRLGDGDLRAVEAFVLLADGIQLDGEAVCQLADGDADTACAEVVAALDEAGHCTVAEQALDLALLGSVTLLHLAGHGGQRLGVVGLGRTGSAADAVTARAAAQQDDLIPCYGTLTHHVFSRRGSHHCAALKALGNVTVVIDLGNVTGGKTDLVAVGGVAGSGSLGKTALGQLALQSVGKGGAGIAAAGKAHGLMDIGATGQRIADAAADAGGSAAERLDLRGMVVGLVLEHQQPFLVLTVHIGGEADGAGVDLLALVQFGELTALFQRLSADGGDVHEGLRTLGGLLLTVGLHAGGEIAVIGSQYLLILDGDVVEMGGEGGVAAVVGPIGVHEADLGDGGIALLGIAEIDLQELQVIGVHSEAEVAQQGLKASFIQSGEAGDGLHGIGLGVLHMEGLGLVQRSLAGLHGVDHVAANSSHLFLGQRAIKGIDLGAADGGTLTLTQQLNALSGRVGALVELTGQSLHGEHGGSTFQRQFLAAIVHRGLGEHGGLGVIKQLAVDALHVVAVQHTHIGEAGNTQKTTALRQQRAALCGNTGLFFNKYSINHITSPILSVPVRRCRGGSRHLQN